MPTNGTGCAACAFWSRGRRFKWRLTGGRAEDNTRRRGLHLGSSLALHRHRLKHPVKHAHMEVHVLVQAGAEAVDKRHGADVQGRIACLRRSGAVGLQALRNDPQEDAQHHAQHWPVTLHEVTQSLAGFSPNSWTKTAACARLVREGSYHF